MIKTKILITAIFISNFSFSQWSTSTIAESALYVCPGFTQYALTYDDGSSVIFGGLNETQYMQKLDPEGKKIWPSPIQVYNIPGLNFLNNGGVDDGQGGWIVLWGDHRGAEQGQYGYFNNALYMQHIDKNGNRLWPSGGIKLADVTGGIKGGYYVNDGVGGCIIQMYETDFLRSGASRQDRTWLVRYNIKGEKLWEYQLDTSKIEHAIQPRTLHRIGNHIFLSRGDIWYITDTTGSVFTKTALIPTVVEGDTAFFIFRGLSGSIDSLGRGISTYRMARYNKNLDSLWSQEFTINYRENTNMAFSDSYLSDRMGGVYYFNPTLNDSAKRGVRIYRVTQAGVQFIDNEVKVYLTDGGFGFAGTVEAGVYVRNGKAYKFDSSGTSVWPTDFTVISNPSDAYFQQAYSDNNGGAIVTYWTTLGGIYAQHTGRKGKVGVITKVPVNENVSLQFELSQNFPNPFNPTTTIQFTVNHDQFVTLKIFDVIGREVKTLVNEKLQRGRYEAKFDASKLSSGIYFYQLHSENFMQTKKMLLIK